ncbi:filaggrin [Tachysurus ichikawai]
MANVQTHHHHHHHHHHKSTHKHQHCHGSYLTERSSSWSSESSLENDKFASKFKKGVCRPQHSQSCTDISRQSRAFEEDEEDTVPLLNEEGHVNRSESIKKYLSMKKKCKDATKGQESSHMPARKSTLKKKKGQNEIIRKVKSMEVLPVQNKQSGEGKLDEKEIERRKEESRKNIMEEKMKFSAFLNEITRQVISPYRLQTLGVTDAHRAINPAKSETSEGKEHKKPKHSSKRSEKLTKAQIILHILKVSIPIAILHLLLHTIITKKQINMFHIQKIVTTIILIQNLIITMAAHPHINILPALKLTIIPIQNLTAMGHLLLCTITIMVTKNSHPFLLYINTTIVMVITIQVQVHPHISILHTQKIMIIPIQNLFTIHLLLHITTIIMMSTTEAHPLLRHSITIRDVYLHNIIPRL